MKLYGGIDLHSNNSVIVLLDDEDKTMYQRRLGNDLQTILEALAPYQNILQGLAVESTYNWYWLVDGLMDAGYPVHLVNTTAVKQYEGLKHGDDHTDARWLAHLLRLGILPQGYIYPQAERPIRDLLRKRGQLVRMRTANLLSIQTLITRNTGGSLNANKVKKLEPEAVAELLPCEETALAVNSNLNVMQALQDQISLLETVIQKKARLKPEYALLKTTPGIGIILALTIML